MFCKFRNEVAVIYLIVVTSSLKGQDEKGSDSMLKQIMIEMIKTNKTIF